MSSSTPAMFSDDWGASCAKRHKVCYTHVDATDQQAVTQGWQLGFTSYLEDTILRGLMEEQTDQQPGRDTHPLQGVVQQHARELVPRLHHGSKRGPLLHVGLRGEQDAPAAQGRGRVRHGRVVTLTTSPRLTTGPT